MFDYTTPKLSGDRAHALFVSSEPFPLHLFLEDWKAGKIEAEPGYILAVIQAFNRMQERHDGRRDGTYRPRKSS